MHAAKPLRELHPSQNPETWLLDSKSQVDFKPGSGFVFQFYCQFLSSIMPVCDPRLSGPSRSHKSSVPRTSSAGKSWCAGCASSTPADSVELLWTPSCRQAAERKGEAPALRSRERGSPERTGSKRRMGAASGKKQWTAGTVFQAAYSTGFWLFVLGNSACMFPLALSIWAVTKPFDKRKVSVAQTAYVHMPHQHHRGRPHARAAQEEQRSAQRKFSLLCRSSSTASRAFGLRCIPGSIRSGQSRLQVRQGCITAKHNDFASPNRNPD